ncbi:MAG: OmpA family protein [Ignavibacteria bacterium]|nr:OmpA family protein [Ignavibacteria bacterium]
MNKYTTLVRSSLVALALCAACSQPKITLDQFGGSADINEGEEATLYWTFANVDSVKISGEIEHFAPSDKFFPRPMVTRTYRITGYQIGGDSLSQDWTIRVNPNRKVGEKLPSSASIEPSQPPQLNSTSAQIQPPTFNGESTYLRSSNKQAQPSPMPPEPVALKVIRSIPPKNGSESGKIHAVLFDKLGSFVGGLDKNDQQIWSGILNCGDKSTAQLPQLITSQTNTSPVTIGIAMNRSVSMSDYASSVFSSIQSFVTSIFPSDYVDVMTFNTLATEAVPLTTSDSARSIFTYLSAPPTGGLSSVYKATRSMIDKLRFSPTDHKYVILITSNSDNASLVVTAKDVIQAARNQNIPIYVISLGEPAESYTLKYLTAATGGKFYSVPASNTSEVFDIMTEINQAQKAYYEITLPLTGAPCPTPNALLSFSQSGAVLQDKAMFYADTSGEFPSYQAVALFEKNNAIVDDGYTSTIELLAAILKDNPDKLIELIGHSSNDDSDDDAIGLALQRTQAVRRMLVAKGVNGSQIRSRAAGNRKPLYYNEQEVWQKIANRRVEIRWLDPALLPYEIAAEQVATEDEALKMTERWEDRGQKAYYERMVINKAPSYRVKIWGFATIASAQDSAKQLQKQYKMSLMVE